MRAAATAAVLITVFASPALHASARPSGRAAATQSLQSGKWSVAPSTTVVTFPVSVSAATPQYLTVTNTGTLTLMGTTYSIVVAGVTTGTIALKACSGTWNESTHTCSGTTSTIVSATTATSPAAGSTTTAGQYPDVPGAALRLQLSDSGAVTVLVTVTLTVTVSRSQVRAAATTNS